MATIKSYTDLEQSKKLAEILPLESADMFYNEEPDETYPKNIVITKYPMVIREGQKHYLEEYGIPCWSLAALLSVLPRYELNNFSNTIQLDVNLEALATEGDETLLDLVVNMIIHLHELNLL